MLHAAFGKQEQKGKKWYCSALAGEFTASDRVGEDTASDLLLHVPFRSTLGLPGPVEPAGTLLISIKLTFDEATKVASVILRHSIHGSSRLALTAADRLTTTGESTIVAGTDTLSVQVLGTVGHGTGPLTNNSPLIIGLNMIFGKAADVVDVGFGVHGEKTGVKHFVMVGVHHHIPDTGRLAHEAVP